MAEHPQDAWVFCPAGDRTLILEFGQSIQRDIVDQVVALDSRIHIAIETGVLKGVLETIPTFRSLALVFDPLTTTPEELLAQIRALEQTEQVQDSSVALRHWVLPVRYGAEAGPDLSSVAELTGLDEAAVIELHLSTQFKVYMLGFLPGFAFLGDTPKELHLPRRSEPRLRVPAGSVAIAKQLTGIYPWDSPGGWHILGNCPVPLFDSSQDSPTLFKTGDIVSFRSINAEEFQMISTSVTNMTFDRSSLQQLASQ
ncbi:5-oxoprolinase subunit PxpB [Granulosicoccus antarcticus]|uniref:Kinase A inhibitor n=1 Tax=Granulosicoccus antarcticus IMCC3135 TaxID=1192854 RepID=A0A2Z2P138_9GAMM|nr:5-oxoprolinase subunit PxpB [Granulosicoccus antarcticus]ASJ74940.1 Kinase A inhibitor [Granulosicoccus antarcticus IMCC3135]